MNGYPLFPHAIISGHEVHQGQQIEVLNPASLQLEPFDSGGKSLGRGEPGVFVLFVRLV